MKNGLIYARVSTEEQAKEGQSIEAQVKLCKQYASENKIHIVDVYKDEGKSGSNTNRPGLQSMLERIMEDKTIDYVLVLDTDRLARNTLDHLSIKALLKKHNTQLISISQPMIDDSPEGRFIDVVLAGANALTSQITGRKTSKIMEQKAKGGWWPGWAPISYQNATNPHPTSSSDKRIVIPDPKTAPLITQMFKLYATGTFTLETLTRKANSLGLTNRQGGKITESSIHQTLTNPFYYGALPWRGEILKGNHQALIDKPTWDTCQQILADHNLHANRKRKHFYLLRGFIYCYDCGSRYWAAPHKGNTTIKHYYYCKKCKKGTYTDVNKLERQVVSWFGKIQITNGYAHELISEAKKVLQELRNSTKDDQKVLINQRTAIEKKIQTTEDRLLDETLTKEQFQKIYSRLEEELANINQSLSQTSGDYSRSFESIKQLVNMARNIKHTYKEADPDLKRYYLDLFFGKIYIKDHKIKEALPSKALKPLIKEGKIKVRVSKNWLPGLDSNQ